LNIDNVYESETLLCIFIQNLSDSTLSKFITEDQAIIQAGIIHVNPNREINRHRHNKILRNTMGTSEVLIVVKGQVVATIFSEFSESMICKRILKEGDVVILFNGGHGFSSQEDSILFEVKNGPYSQAVDKVYF